MSAEDLKQSKRAELKRAFVAHLPQRIAVVQKRLRRLCQDGWDINDLSLLYEEVQSVAGASGTHGLVEESEQMFALEVYLSSFIESTLIPNEAQTGEILKLVAALDQFAASDEEMEALAQSTTTTQVRQTDGPVAADEIPDAQVPPAGFVPAPAHGAAAPATAPVVETDATPDAEPQPADEEKANPLKLVASSEKPDGVRTIYYLRSKDAQTEALIEQLGELHNMETFEDVSDFREALLGISPDMILVGTTFLEHIEDVGESVVKIRKNATSNVPMVVFSDTRELALRLRVMRAGADAFLLNSLTVDEVAGRVNELLAGAVDEPYRVLIVEDNRSEAKLTESILKKSGMEVHVIMKPLDIMQELDAFNPELILMDLYMPDCDGMELTAIIRERSAFISTPIVFLSGETDPDKHFDALNAGGDDFLAKPVQPHHLISAVRNRIRRARATAQRIQQPNPNDAITGLYERQHLLNQISAALATEDRAEMGGGLLYVELDSPYTVREQVGLQGFDELMKLVGTTLAESTTQSDFASRFSDNAFAVLIQGESRPELCERAEHMLRSINDELIEIDGKTVPVKVSVGVCPFDPTLADAGAMMSAAERACSKSRRLKPGNYLIFEPPKRSEVLDTESEISRLIDQALQEDSLQMVYQPIVSLKGDNQEQYQVLLRLPSETGGAMPASKFIPVAEESGQIAGIDKWVLGQAMSVVNERQDQEQPLRLFINQSGPSLGNRERAERIRKSIETRQLSAGNLAIEFKLPDIINQLKQAKVYFQVLSEAGVLISLAAFDGSSTAFQLLDHLHVDYVKLSQNWSSDEPQANQGHDLGSLVSNLHDAGKKVIVPAIEDARSAARLWTSGADFIQGNFVQKPDHELRFDFRESAF